MANSSIDPGRRDDDLETPGEGGPDRGRLTAAGRDDLLDPDAPDRPLTAAGRDDLAREDRIDDDRVGTRAATGDSTVPRLDDDPIGPGGGGPVDLPPHDETDEHGRSFAATALMLLVFALVIFGLSLWLVPNLAPHLPAGVARHLMPGQLELNERLAALDERIGAGSAGVTEELAALREAVTALADRVQEVEETAAAAEASAADSAASAEQNAVAGDGVARAEAAAVEANRLAETATTAATEAGNAAATATRETASLARRMADFEARLTELANQVQAVSDSLAEGGADGQAAAPELAAGFAALRSEVEGFRQRLAEQPEYLTASEAERFATQDDLRSARMAMVAEIQQAVQALPPPEAIVVKEELQALRQEAEGAVGLLDQRIDEATTTAEQATDVAAKAEEAATTAVERVDAAIRDARLGAAAASLTSRLLNGVPFADALDEAAALLDAPAPEPLAAVAAEGVPTTTELARGLSRVARSAIEADIEARTGGGILGQASARFQSVLAGRPAGELPGETVEAILSRIEARLREGDARAALAEADALPDPVQEALGEWLARLRARVAAADAAEEWLSPAGGATQG